MVSSLTPGPVLGQTDPRHTSAKERGEGGRNPSAFEPGTSCSQNVKLLRERSPSQLSVALADALWTHDRFSPPS